jgi:drug/metabolite transporter (DMT)-like permease
MLFDNNLFTVEKRLLSILLMTIGSVAISFNGLVLRNIETADDWTIIFYRALSFSITIFIYLFFIHKKRIFKKIIQIGISGLIGGFVLGISNVCFILSMTTTSVANTVFTISLIPFITALFSLLILKEKLAQITVYTMIAAFFGVLMMFYGSLKIGELWGNMLALITAISFSIYTIIIRSNKNIDMLPCLLISGIMAMGLTSFQNVGSLQISTNDFFLCFLLGGVLSGFVNCCFVFATRHLIAAEATLFFFIEIALSPFWVWLFLNEIISPNTLIGGIIILISILIRALYLRHNKIKI